MRTRFAALLGVVGRAGLVCVVAGFAGCGGEVSPHVRLHPPSSERERAAARVAFAFAVRLQRGDARGVCDVARGAARRTLHCSRKPRIPRWLSLRQRPEVIDVTPARVPGATCIRLRPGAPILAIEVDPAGRVVHLSAYGYA